MIPYTKEAYRLFHDGTLAFAEVEANGIRIDQKYLTSTLKLNVEKQEGREKAIASSEVVKVWRKRYRGDKFNLNSGEQLGTVLFEVMGFDSPGLTKGGKHKTDVESLNTVDHPFIKNYVALKKIQKTGQFLKGIQREVVRGLLHPSFNLQWVRSFRSSSSDPNFQNLPARDMAMMKAVRTCFIARKKRVLVEIDIKGAEVLVAACYHKDPTMIRYIKDPTKDMHRDMAMQCYKLPLKEMTKPIRQRGKTDFVFPEFYGDYWMSCSKALWEACIKFELVTASGVPLRKHLRRKGLKRLGNQEGRPSPRSFEEHISQVEKHFWYERFPVYSEWKKEWYEAYLKKGWFLTKTGFICKGFLKKNQVINYPVQGSAFHCLLWVLIELLREIKARGMKTLIVGQIHDSIEADCPEEEVEELVMITQRIFKRLKRIWTWLLLPLEIEVEVTPVGGSWADKVEISL